MGRWTVAAWATFVGGCTLATSIDVCQRASSAEAEINTRTDGDQGIQVARAITSTPDGRGFAAFTSVSDTDPMRAEVRVVRFSADAQPLRTCGETGDHTIAAGAATDPPVYYGTAAVVASSDPTLPVMVSYSADQADRDELWLDALDPESGCGFFDESLPELFPIRLAESGPGLLAPGVGAWTGSDVFLFAWIEIASDLSSTGVFARAMSLNAAGFVYQDLVDLRTGERVSDRPVPVDDGEGQVLGVDLLPVNDRVFVARFVGVGEEREVRVGIHRADLSVVVPDFRVSGRFRDAPTPQVALAFDGTQVAVAWSQSSPDGSASVYGRLLTTDGDSLRSALTPDGEPFRLGTTQGLSERAPALVSMPGGGFLAAWSAVTADGSTQSVRATILGDDGDRAFANRACGRADFALPGAGAGEQGNVSLARLGESVVAAWSDAGGNGSDTDGFAVRAAVFPPRSLLPLR